jgi:hypothetical protein
MSDLDAVKKRKLSLSDFAVECKVFVSVQDVLDTREDITTKVDALRFLEQNSKHIEAAMVEASYVAIENLWLEDE